MDTLRVDICYRPLRIGWVIQSGDVSAFRQAVKLSHTLWGGRFNPILMAVCHVERGSATNEAVAQDLLLVFQKCSYTKPL